MDAMDEPKWEALKHCRDATAALAAGNPINALRCAAKAQSADPHLAKAWYVCGCAHFTLAGYCDAHNAFQEGLKIKPGHRRMLVWVQRAAKLAMPQPCGVCGAATDAPLCGMPCRLVRAAQAWHRRGARVLSSLRPTAVEIPAFLTSAQCHALIRAAEPRLAPSGSFGAPRSSSTCFLREGENCRAGVTVPLLLKIVALTQRRVEHFERVQVTRYLPGQRFGMHHDAFDPESAEGRARLECPASGGQRVCTVLVYLNTLARGAGGQTAFSAPGLSCAPEQGKALVFCPTLASGALDPAALHEAQRPVGEVKWVTQVWIRQAPASNNASLGTVLESGTL